MFSHSCDFLGLSFIILLRQTLTNKNSRDPQRISSKMYSRIQIIRESYMFLSLQVLRVRREVVFTCVCVCLYVCSHRYTQVQVYVLVCACSCGSQWLMLGVYVCCFPSHFLLKNSFIFTLCVCVACKYVYALGTCLVPAKSRKG